mgnify:CR=1 FL=1|tara:strand:+ start:9271 stop:9507 length:237 start_codon:yes stop_codon:yes gene_type:complete
MTKKEYNKIRKMLDHWDNCGIDKQQFINMMDEMLEETESINKELKAYQKGFNYMLEYYNYLSHEDRKILNTKLNKIGL